MALPKLKSPTFTFTVPSTKQEIVYRPFTVQEEKVLLIAQESKDQKAIIRSVQQIINNCIVEGEIDVDDFAPFDIEFFFLQLRARSVNNVLRLKITDPDDVKVTHNYEVDLDDVHLTFPEGHERKIQLTDELGVTMRYPSLTALSKFDFDESNMTEDIFGVIKETIESVYDSENVYPFHDETPEEQDAFLDSLSSEAFQKLRTFYDTMPKLEHDVTITRPDKTTFTIPLRGLSDFFSYA